MKCPLIVTERYFDNEERQAIMADCLKEECAWWDKTRKACAVEHIAYSLRIVAEELVDIRHKMPHAGQFTK